MSVKINISSLLQHITNGIKTTEVKGHTVGECLEDLIKQFPRMEQVLFSKKGELHSYVDIYVNKESAYPDELAKPVKDGDELTIALLIGGG